MFIINYNFFQPFYGGKLHRVTAEVKNNTGTVLYKVQGEWDSILEFSYSNGEIDVSENNFFPFKKLN